MPELRPIPWTTDYAASADGRIWAVWEEYPHPMTHRVHKSADGREHLRVRLTINGRVHDYYVMRLIAEAFHSESYSPGATARAINENPLDCRAENIGWGTTRSTLPDSEFVRAWQSSYSLAEAAEKCGVGSGAAYSRAEKMRQRGVPLKNFACHDLSTEELRALAEE
jgi:hypothetical protein